MKRAIGYIRVSTQDQARMGMSLPAQRDAIQDYCERHGFELVEIIEDPGVTAKRPLHRRPGGKQVLTHTRKRKDRIDAVVAAKHDRVFRVLSDAISVVEEWQKKGIELHYVDAFGQAVDTSNAMGWGMFIQRATFAEMERRMIGERTKASMDHIRKTSNKRLSGRAPFGYEFVNGMKAENPAEQEIIRLVEELRSNGMKYRAIAAHLNELKTAQEVCRGKQWHLGTVQTILRAA